MSDRAESVPYLVVLALLLTAALYLGSRMQTAERRLRGAEHELAIARDDLAAERERARQPLARAGVAAAEPKVAEAAPAPAVPSSAPSSSPTLALRAPTVAAANDAELATRYLKTRLLPGDALLASMLLAGSSVTEIGARTRHSAAFVIAKGAMLEKALADDPATPPAVLRGFRAALAEARRGP